MKEVLCLTNIPFWGVLLVLILHFQILFEADNGIDAVDKALNKKPDLILLDIMLPKMDGLTVCKKIRHNYNIPIIMLSAKDEEIDKIFKFWIEDCGVKGFRLDAVLYYYYQDTFCNS